MKQEKVRASNNRTLSILPSEVESLRAMLTRPEQIDDDEVLLSDITGTEQYWTDRLVNGDLMAVIDRVPDAMADLIIIDPPYNLSRDFGNIKFVARTEARYDEYLRTWFHKVCQKLKPDGTLYLCGDWRCTASLQRVMDEELTILNRITWQREKGRGAQTNWKNAMEDIWFGVHNPKDYHFDVNAVMQRRRVIAPYRSEGKPKDWEETEQGNFRTTYPSNFWDDISVPFWSMPENTDHPTQKPEKLYAKLILASSAPGDMVFDPFMGSGTACVVAQKLGRHYLGIEINEEYCLWSAKRLVMAKNDPTIQGYADGVFWERNTSPAERKK